VAIIAVETRRVGWRREGFPNSMADSASYDKSDTLKSFCAAGDVVAGVTKNLGSPAVGAVDGGFDDCEGVFGGGEKPSRDFSNGLEDLADIHDDWWEV
jgi:hypothetical protein